MCFDILNIVILLWSVVSFIQTKGICLQNVLLNDFDNNNNTMWSIFYTCTYIYSKDTIFR